MSVRVRFAPSPTGHLHIGGARTALYNYLYAKLEGGTFILRVEDTDLERSSKEFEQSQMADLKWLGMNFDEGPELGGQYGPYRQSERLEIYQEYAQKLLDKGMAFYDFCSDEELEAMKQATLEYGDAPYTGRWREKSSWDEAKQRVAAGEKAPIRFLAPDKAYSFQDKVRGEVKFPPGMVGDFVIIRSNDMPTYNYCCVIDDYLMKITHVIRGEDHVNNTLRQLMIYDALEATPPVFTHASLLIGKDRQKLSKRHGATSVRQYRDEGYEADALNNYLCLLGWSHPEEKDIFTLEDAAKHFSLDRFSRSQAIYDIEKLTWMNGQHIKHMESSLLKKRLDALVSEGHFYHKQSLEWQNNCVELFKEKLIFAKDFETQVNEFVLAESFPESETLKEIFSWETTPTIAKYVQDQLSSFSGSFVSADTFSGWMDHCKGELKIKGKPLFMGFRSVLTGQDHGPDLKILIPLTPVSVLKSRLEKVLS